MVTHRNQDGELAGFKYPPLCEAFHTCLIYPAEYQRMQMHSTARWTYYIGLSVVFRDGRDDFVIFPPPQLSVVCGVTLTPGVFMTSFASAVIMQTNVALLQHVPSNLLRISINLNDTFHAKQSRLASLQHSSSFSLESHDPWRPCSHTSCSISPREISVATYQLQRAHSVATG